MIHTQEYIDGTNQTVKKPGDLVFGLRGQLFRVDNAGVQQPYAGRVARAQAQCPAVYP